MSENQVDLTPDAASHAAPYGASEALAEVEAFMGEGWTCHAWPGIHRRAYVVAQAHGFELCFNATTYRAAVDALLQAWRDAVRPWVAEAVHESGTHAARIAKTYDEAPERRAWDTAEAAILTDLHDPDDPDTLRVIARVLKED